MENDALLIEDIVELLFISKSKVKYTIEKLGIVPVKRGRQNQVYYSREQVELIKENNPIHYAKNDEIFGIWHLKTNL